MTSAHDLINNTPTANLWQKVGIESHHGVSISLPSLHSESSCGIGEYLDLIPVISWCTRVGFDVLQLLPINDTGTEPSPYHPLSSCALNPIYLTLSRLPDAANVPNFLEHCHSLRALNGVPHVAYKEVLEGKLAALTLYYNTLKTPLLNNPDFHTFLENNSWVMPYALFKALSVKFETSNFNEWPEEYRSCQVHHMKENEDKALFFAVLQFLCFQELLTVREYADVNHVFLKGDLPISMSQHSADVWLYPHYFDTTLSTGAPPDIFNKDGQYWGFPSPKWEAMKEDNHTWWKERLRVASNFYHIYRIDHVIGLFHLWVIPLGSPPTTGHYVPDEPQTMIRQGEELLKMLVESSSMLPIAEDLGTIPIEVAHAITVLGICGTRLFRFEKEIKDFTPFARYSPLSLVTVSTHDTTTLQEWWQENPSDAKIFADGHSMAYEKELSATMRHELLKLQHASPSLFHIDPLQEYLALIPHFVRNSPFEERINVPGEKLDTNWTYRYLPSIETFSDDTALEDMLYTINGK